MKNKTILITALVIFLSVSAFIGLKFFSEENQNKFSRAINTTLGMKDGCVEVFAGQRSAVKRWFNVEKFSTAFGTSDGQVRPYRYGYGYLDFNLNDKLDPEEKALGKGYFEVNDFSQAVYFERKNK